MNEPTLYIRPAAARDTADMLEITRSIWNGDDYLPLVWDEWLADCTGYLATLEVGGQVAGFQHVQVLEDGTGWIEGIRVREDTQSRGLGFALLADGVRWAREAGLPRVRLCTHGANPASNRIATRAGLSEIARVKILSADATPEQDAERCRVATAADFDEVERVIGEHAGSDPVYTEGWTAHSLDVRRLRLLLATHAVLVFGAPSAEGVAIASTAVEHVSLRLGFIVGSDEAVATLARSLVRRTAAAGLHCVVCYAAISSETESTLEREGYIWRDRDEMVLYELDLRDEVPVAGGLA
jgi:GNAT superfamily N-acetyltransferase